MLKLYKLDDNIIDLDGIKTYNEEFTVISANENGKPQPFYVELVSSEAISVDKYEGDKLSIYIDVEYVLKNEYIALKNLIGDRILITVKPNQYFVNDRTYKFKLTKTEEKEDGSLRIKILSKVNGKEMSWKCTYDGRPNNYDITPMESEKSEFVNIKINSTVLNAFTSKIEFTQDESNETISLDILNTVDGLKLK